MKYWVAFLCVSLNVWAIMPTDNAELKKVREVIGNDDSDQIAKKLVQIIAPSMPQQVNAYGTFNYVTHVKNHLLMSYMISTEEYEKMEKEPFPQDAESKDFFIQATKKFNSQSLCTNPFIYAAFEKGVILDIEVHLSDFTFYGRTSVGIQDCNAEPEPQKETAKKEEIQPLIASDVEQEVLCGDSSIKQTTMEIIEERIKDSMILHLFHTRPEDGFTYNSVRKAAQDNPVMREKYQEVDSSYMSLAPKLMQIRTIGIDDRLYITDCAANVVFSDGDTMPIEYRISKTTDNEFYIEVSEQ